MNENSGNPASEMCLVYLQINNKSRNKHQIKKWIVKTISRCNLTHTLAPVVTHKKNWHTLEHKTWSVCVFNAMNPRHPTNPPSTPNLLNPFPFFRYQWSYWCPWSSWPIHYARRQRRTWPSWNTWWSGTERGAWPPWKTRNPWRPWIQGCLHFPLLTLTLSTTLGLYSRHVIVIANIHWVRWYKTI